MKRNVSPFAGLFLLAFFARQAAARPDATLIPCPRSVERGSGQLALSAGTRIVAAQSELKPLADVLAEECRALTGLRPATATGAAAAGDIGLALDPAARGEAYTLTVGEQAAVRGGTYEALAAGTATLLQLLQSRDGRIGLPRVTIRDEPFSPYRCILIDVARQTHSIDTLKKIVVLCRFYKIRYLQLHLTDDQAFTFPSTAFPDLVTKERHFTLDELRDLESFAARRGVAILPEIETPGHSGRMRAVKPFGGPAPGVIDMASEEMYKALDTLVGEVCDVFKTTPYFHMGGDECWLEKVGETAGEKAYIEQHKLPYPHALYDHFIGRMNEIVRRHGKQTVVWEGFRGKGAENCTIPDNVIVLAWETMYQTPDSLLKNGYTIVNATWRPLYIVGDTLRDPADIYGWNLYLWKNHWRYAPSFIPIQLSPETVLPDGKTIRERVIGGQMSVWEQTEDSEVPRIRLRLPAMSERIWNPDWPADSSARASEKAFRGFMARLQPLDAKAGLLMTPIRLQFDGLTDPSASGYHNKENWHNRPLTITMAPSVPGAQVRYTTNGAAPDLQSPACAGPITLAEPKTVLRARAFDSAGAPLGQTLWETYEYRPIEARVTANGLFKADDERDHDGFERGAAVTVALSAPAQRGGAIRTALSGPVTEKSPSYSGPILITNDTDFSAGYFDAAGKLVGQAYRRKFEVFKNFERSLTTDKPATSSKGAADPENPGVVCDGFVFDRGFWSGGPCPDWWQVDLGRVHTLDKIQVVTYWDGGRYYQYYVEVSRDGRLWKKVIDRTRSTEKATDKGYTETFAPTPGRYIRVTVTRNSANPGVHMVEVRAWEAKRP